MRKLPFSYESIREVYDKENRKGNVDLAILPTDYCDLIKTIHDKRLELSRLRKISTKRMDDDSRAAHYSLISSMKDEIKDLSDLKEKQLSEILLDVERKINDKSYSYEIERDENYFKKTGEECFHTKGDSLESMIMSKLLCLDLASSFKVKASNRHHIMSCVKSLLVSDRSFVIIRTDIQSFFETIPHELVFQHVNGNPFVSKKTIGCIRSVLEQYDSIKFTGNIGIGVPRGIAISSYISEIIMRNFDMWLKSQPNVMFYARYVDDIIIILSHLRSETTIDNFFSKISTSISKLGLNLHPQGSSKSVLIDYNPNCGKKQTFEYLGYRIRLNPKNITFLFSDKRYDRITKRINNAFKYFESNYKKDPRKARIDLIDCLNLLSGNTGLHKSKFGVKTGLYFSNDLISDECEQLHKIQAFYIHCKVNRLSLEVNPFGDEVQKDAYFNRLKNKLNQINFVERWKKKTMFSFSVKRMKELSNILGE